jgi:hypothetical protein
MNQGYLYILINPTMPGLAKVGRTTRDPTTRAGELSSATGVASPFILAYSQPVNDCISAERWVHSQLENAGFRHASNREFFNAPLHEIVPIVFGAAQHCIESTDSDGRADTDSDDIVHGLRTMAEHYRDGEGVLVNKHKALELFEQAAQFGDGMSAVAGGMLAQYGGGNLRPDLEKALTMYRVAVRQGDWWVNAYIAELFMEAGRLILPTIAGLSIFNRRFQICPNLKSRRMSSCQSWQIVDANIPMPALAANSSQRLRAISLNLLRRR